MANLGILNKVQITSDIDAAIVISYHLLTQGEKAISSSDCAYRGYFEDEFNDEDDSDVTYGDPDGTSCAVGCLIKDRFYDWSLEGNSIDDLNVQDAVIASHEYWAFNHLSRHMLSMFQNIHDKVNRDLWPIALELIYGAIIAHNYHSTFGSITYLTNDLRHLLKTETDDVGSLKKITAFSEIMTKRKADLFDHNLSSEIFVPGEIKLSLLQSLEPHFENICNRSIAEEL
jgi:hypothetical protein